MKFGSLFSGIGGLDLGLERAGMECAWQVEIDDYCTKVLTKHWPDVPKYKDIRDVGKKELEPVDLICGGFPCQPFSVAGKRKGTADDRHLWPEMLRVISELKPTWVLGENVPGIINIFLDQAISDMEAEGYTCESYVLPACAFDAYHRRDRLFIIAYDESHLRRTSRNERPTAFNRGNSFLPNAKNSNGWRPNRTKNEGRRHPEVGGQSISIGRLQHWLPEPQLGRVAHGIPHRVDRLRGLGNAVVPQVAEFIGRQIMKVDGSDR